METQTLTENNQVSVITKSLDLLKTGPQILAANQQRKDKALTVGRNILMVIQEEGMSPATDERAMKYLANVGSATTEMKESRAAVTQIMTQLTKMYTSVENDLDVTKPGTIPAQIQDHRNQFVKDQAAAAEQKRKEAEKVAAKAREAIELKSSIEVQFAKLYNNYLLEMKQKIQNTFNSITLDDYNEKSVKLKAYAPVLNKEKIFDFKPAVFALAHTPEEVTKFHKIVCDDKATEFIANYAAELSLLRDDLIDKLPSKLSELKEHKRLSDQAAAEAERQRIEKEKSDVEIAKANAAQKKKLEAEAEKVRIANETRNAQIKREQEEAAEAQRIREEEDANKLTAQAAEAERKSVLQSDIKKQGEQTMVLFDQEATLADSTPAPEARQGYEITVTHPVGYTQIFAFWMDKEGKNLPVDKIGNTKCDQMKAFCEKVAFKDGSFIDSKFLKYQSTYKAVNRKAAKV